MNWRKYRERYSHFLLSLLRAEMIIFHVEKVIPDQPTKVKESEKVETPFFVHMARQTMIDVSGGQFRTDHLVLDGESMNQLIFDGNVEWVVSCQKLVMIIAHLEAFVADTFKAVWRQDTNLLVSTSHARKQLDKQFGGRNINSLSSEEFDDLGDYVTWELMRKSTDAYMDYLKNHFGLNVTVDQRALFLANLNRHAVIHNGGLASSKYIKNLNNKEKKGVSLGMAIPVNRSYTQQIFNLIQSFGENIFEEASKQYFGQQTPVKDNERVVGLQSPDLKENPLVGLFSEAIRKNKGKK